MIQHIYVAYAIEAGDVIAACEDLESWSLTQARKYEGLAYNGVEIDKIIKVSWIQNPVL